MRYSLLFACIFSCFAFLTCAPKTAGVDQSTKTVTPPAVEEELVPLTDNGKVLQVQVKSENIRAKPNGTRLGQLKKGNPITVIKRVGNWIYFKNNKYDGAYIWAPSVGYTYENLYSPFFYYDTTRNQFYDVSYFQTIFSQKGQRRQDIPSAYELFFKDIGLGSHEAVILDVVVESQQVVEHGITLYINPETDKIEKVRVDYYRPVDGYKTALKKSELPVKDPVASNNSHLIWPAGTLLPRLTVDLERKEWDSKQLSSIWYIQPARN